MEQTILIAIVVGLIQAIQLAFKLPSRFKPILSLALGIGLAFLGVEGSVSNIIFSGIIIGLSASGLYSGAKAVVKK